MVRRQPVSARRQSVRCQSGHRQRERGARKLRSIGPLRPSGNLKFGIQLENTTLPDWQFALRIAAVVTSVMACDEKARLLKGYQATTEKFSDAVTALQQMRGTLPLTEYQRLQRLANEARLKSEQARLALEEHVVSHSC